MNQRPQRDDDEMRELLARLERDLGSRTSPAMEIEPRHDRDQMYTAPQPQRRTLPFGQARVVYVLLAINILMYVVTTLLAQAVGFTNALFILGAKQNQAIDAGQWWRLLTPMVLHGGLAHLMFNTWALYILGTEAERIYGSIRFLAIYLVAGLAGSIASYVFNPGALSVGASGAIFGLLGALAAFAYVARSLIGKEASKMQLGQIVTLAGINLMFGFLPGTNIDNAAHIGGLVVGVICGVILAPRYQVEYTYNGPALIRRNIAPLDWLLVGLVLAGLIAWFVLY
jgi:rhomboid protease GluP